MAQHTDPLPSYVYLPISQEEIVQATASIGLQDGHQNTQSDLDQLMAIAAMVANERRNQTEVAWNERLDQELETMSCANSEVSVEQTQIEDEFARLTSGSSKQKNKVQYAFFFEREILASTFGPGPIWSCIVCSKTIWSWTINNLEEYYILSQICSRTIFEMLLQEHKANILLEQLCAFPGTFKYCSWSISDGITIQ